MEKTSKINKCTRMFIPESRVTILLFKFEKSLGRFFNHQNKSNNRIKKKWKLKIFWVTKF